MGRRAFVSLLVVVSGFTGAFAQPPADCYNTIGIYTDPAPTAETIADLVMYEGVPGEFDAYIVLTNPYNTSLDQPITVVGGFEFRIELPAGVFLLSAFLPPNSTNFASAPGEFLCDTNLPVVNGAATCVSITLGAFTQTENHIYLTPVEDAPQTYPGEIVVTDFNDGFRISLAQPSSGDFAAPVFGLWPAEGVQLLPCLLPEPDLVVELPPTVAVEATLGDTVSVVVRVTNLGSGSDTIGFSIADPASGFSIDDPLLAVADADSTVLRFVPTAEGITSTQLTALQTGTGLAQVFDLVGEGFVPGRYVSPDGDNDTGDGTRTAPWATIQFAIDQADTGDAVVLLAGTYRGNGNRDLDFRRKGVLLRSAGGDPAEVIIDCDGTEAERHVGIHFRPGEPAGTAVEGITIRDAYGPAAMPAAVYIDTDAPAPGVTSSTIRLARCVVDSTAGNGIMATPWGVDSDVVLTLDDCRFLHNSGNGATLFELEPGSIISACVFEGNGGHGFVLTFAYGHETITGCQFLANGGSGCEFSEDYAGKLSASTLALNGRGFRGYGELEDCFVHDNTGDGVVFLASNSGRGNLRRCDVHDNGGHGVNVITAKLRAQVGSDKILRATIEDSEIHDNGGDGVHSAADYTTCSGVSVHGNAGNGIFLDGSGGDYDSVIDQCTVADNGGGVVLLGISPGTVTNSIIAFNAGCGISGDIFAPDTTPLWTFANNDVYANTGGDSCVGGLPVPGAGFIAKDPLFCDAATGDYGLAANSPCAGSALHALMGAATASCAGVDAPVMYSVADIPEDQGGQVRLVWLRSGQDESGSAFPVLGYDVYRRATPGASAKRTDDGRQAAGLGLRAAGAGAGRPGLPDGGGDPVGLDGDRRSAADGVPGVGGDGRPPGVLRLGAGQRLVGGQPGAGRAGHGDGGLLGPGQRCAVVVAGRPGRGVVRHLADRRHRVVGGGSGSADDDRDGAPVAGHGIRRQRLGPEVLDRGGGPRGQPGSADQLGRRRALGDTGPGPADGVRPARERAQSVQPDDVVAVRSAAGGAGRAGDLRRGRAPGCQAGVG